MNSHSSMKKTGSDRALSKAGKTINSGFSTSNSVLFFRSPVRTPLLKSISETTFVILSETKWSRSISIPAKDSDRQQRLQHSHRDSSSLKSLQQRYGQAALRLQATAGPPLPVTLLAPIVCRCRYHRVMNTQSVSNGMLSRRTERSVRPADGSSSLFRMTAWVCLRWLLVILLLCSSTGLAQSLWLETGLAYRNSAESGNYQSNFRVGLRGTLPLSNIVSLYTGVALQGGLVVDAGGWFRLPTALTDPFGLRTYLGAGLTYTAGSLGLALSAALSYQIAPNIGLTLSYTHRPLFIPRLSQAFELSAGVRLGFD